MAMREKGNPGREAEMRDKESDEFHMLLKLAALSPWNSSYNKFAIV